MSTIWHTTTDAAKRVKRSPRTIRRWIEADLLKVTMGRVKEAELLEVERQMRGRVGRPKKRVKLDHET